MSEYNLTTLQILLIIIVPSLITGTPAIISTIAARKNRRKLKAEALVDEGTAVEKVSGAYDKLVEDLQKRIDIMESRQNRLELTVEKQNKRIYQLEQGVHKLVAQITSLGEVPVFTLETPKPEQPKE